MTKRLFTETKKYVHPKPERLLKAVMVPKDVDPAESVNAIWLRNTDTNTN